MPHLAPLISELLDCFDDRHRAILTQRVLTSAPVTMTSLPTEWGISPERVRALEAHATSRLRRITEASRFAPLHWRSANWRTTGASTQAPPPAKSSAT
jgi:DNA-directed RNA polymerase sigma subunit (sigma70/sigma32)